MSNVFGEDETSDWILASLLSYAGYPVTKVVVSNLKEVVWTFKGVPSEDFKIYAVEAKDKTTTVVLQDFISAQKTVQHIAALARKNLGVWTGETYRR